MRYFLSFLAYVFLNCQQIQSIEPLKLDPKAFELSASVAHNRDQNHDFKEFSDSEDSSSIINFEGEPSAIVNNCVNAITGDLLDFQTDMVVPGAQPIVIHRNYCSSLKSQSMGGWAFNQHGMLRVSFLTGEDSKGHELEVLNIESSEGSGALLTYQGVNRTGHVAQLTSLRGLTNCGSKEISGRTNRKNSVFHPGKDFYMRTGSGATRHYKQFTSTPFNEFLILSREKMANGNQIIYENKAKENTRFIIAKNSASKTLSSVTQYNNEENPFLIMKSCDGRTSRYRFAKIENRSYLTAALHSHGPKQTYGYTRSENNDSLRLLSRKTLPEKRQTLISYYKTKENQVLNKKIILKKQDPQIDRVKVLKAPVGTTATPVVTHSFFYHIKRDKKYRLLPSYTNVYDALKRKSHEYHYDKNCCLRRVSKMVKGETYRQDRLFWGSGDDNTNLISRVMQSEGQILFCRHLDYDKRGNIRVEQIWGNLTGRNDKPLKVDSKGKPLRNGCEFYKKSFKYSDDGFNLPIYEDNGRNIITSGYAKKTELMTERFISDQERILQRQFYEYDENAVLIKEIRDDGSSANKNSLADVTERHITYITPRCDLPIGLPEIIEEKYLDLSSGQELLLKKKVNAHSKEGNLLSQEHYDSDGKLVYTLKWEYDDHSNLIRETNALGEVTERAYDANCNMILEKGPRSDYHKEFTYDFSNRLIREDEVYEDGTRLSITHKYNLLSQRTSTTDFYGNTTSFQYDECSRLIETQLPNKISVRTEYNALDQPIATYDANGNCTKKTFNIRGKPCHIEYPDGSTETYEYTLDGLLERAVAKNGVVTLYTYDSLKRVISQENLSPSGERLSIISSTYNAFHLLSETDEAGYLTEYQYDVAGRLIAKTKGDSHTEFAYDSLGRIVRTLEYINEHDYRATVKKYDSLDRVISEQIEDASGNIFKKEKYAYDPVGNVTKITTFTQAGQADTQTIYNAHQEPLHTIDALGNTTHTVYRYDYYNEDGECVPCQETTDPLGNITVIIKDVCGQTAQILKRNAFGETTQSLKFTRDNNGNCLSQTAFDPERTIVTEWEYDAFNRIINTTEAVKTHERKHTRYVYNHFGEKKKTIKPDGTELLYTYDDFGRLSSYKGTGFHYTYQYDLNNNPICVKNLVTNTSTQRAYDANDRLITEILENNLQLNYFYDRLGRLLTLSLPDHSEINYSYDANHLRKVCRGSYVHHYTDYDLSENLLSASSPIGKLTYGYDLLSRLTTLTTPETHDTFSYDAIGNLLEKVTPSETLSYTYDSLYQLISEPGHTYKYDSHYNRTAKDGKRYTLNSLNQILKQDTFQYTYSANGALTKKVQSGESSTYFYDGLDRLVKVNQGGSTTTYHYDAFNRRISKTHNDITTNYLYQDQNEIGAYVNGDLKELRVLGLGQGAEIGAAVFVELAGQTYVPTHDQNGNVTALFIPSGECLETYRYTAFGEELSSTSIGNPWRFSSKRHDPETGFLYFGQRYYAADLGRWITPDPLEFEDGPNLYAYVHNNPLTSIDLYGLFDDNDDFNSSFTSSLRESLSGLQGFSTGFCKGSVTNWYNDFGGTYSNFGTKPMRDDGDDWNKSCHYYGERFGETFTMAAGMFAATAVTDMAIAATIPLIAAAATSYGAYKLGSKAINAVVSGARKIVGSQKGTQLALQEKNVLTNLSKCKVSEAEKMINSYLGEGTKLIKNDAGDTILISRDMTRKVRFDFNRPYPHQNPHMHVDQKIGIQLWEESGQIYPKDVPHF